MDETTVNLHYDILQYLYDEQKLPESCFNHVWEEFRAQNHEIPIPGEKLFFVCLHQ